MVFKCPSYSHRSPGAYMVSRMVRNSWGLLACVASISNRVIARKLEWEQKKMEGGRGGEGRRGNACLQTPRFRKTPLDISWFGSFVYWQLVKIEAFFFGSRPNFLNELVRKRLLCRLEVCSGRHVDVCMQARIHCRPLKGCMEKALNWMSPDLISKFPFWFVSVSERNWKENVAVCQSIWVFLQVPLSLAWVWVGWWYNAWQSRVPMFIITNT